MNLASATREIRQDLNFLYALGITALPEKVQRSTLLGHFITLPYANPAVDRLVDRHLSAGRGPRDPSIAASISDSSNRHLAVHDRLRLHPEQAPLPDIAADATEGSIAAYCLRQQQLFTGPLPNVLAGQRWVDAPVDWQGLR